MANGAVNTVSRVGQINGTGNADALFLKVFSNEILTTFEEANVMKDLHTVRTISSGKEAQFPVIGSAEAKYFSVGEDVLESSVGDASAQVEMKDQLHLHCLSGKDEDEHSKIFRPEDFKASCMVDKSDSPSNSLDLLEMFAAQGSVTKLSIRRKFKNRITG